MRVKGKEQEQAKPDLLGRKEAASKTQSAQYSMDHFSGMHNWYACSHARPTYCNVCREALSGVTSHGLSCEVCKFKSHRRCAVRATNNCKWTTLASIGKDIIEDEDGIFETSSGRSIMYPCHTNGWKAIYRLVQNALCEKTCGSVLRLQDWQCLWCKAAVHSSCKEFLPKKCPLGQCKVSVIPPTALNSIDSDGFWKATCPPSCTSPLLVFVNSKSGDNQGVKFLRRFKQLLNPAQVFDLMNGGPHLGLRLFQKFDTFRILVCGGDGSVGWVLSEIDTLNLHKQCQLGVLPLGTGNDLARVLGWGSACDDDTQLPQILEKLERAGTKMLDRWSIMVYETKLPARAPDPCTSPESSEDCEVQQILGYEDSVAAHLSQILSSDQHSVVISSAKSADETRIGVEEHGIEFTHLDESRRPDDQIKFRTFSDDQRCHSGILIAAACQTQRDRYPGRCNVTDHCRSRWKVVQCEGRLYYQGKSSRSPLRYSHSDESSELASLVFQTFFPYYLRGKVVLRPSPSLVTKSTKWNKIPHILDECQPPIGNSIHHGLCPPMNGSEKRILRVLCETVKDFVARVGKAYERMTESCEESETMAGKCNLLREKLDSLLNTLNEESQATSVLSQPPPTISEEGEESSETVACLTAITPSPGRQLTFRPREQLMLRANSLKKAIRQIIEQAEKAVDEQNAQTPSSEDFLLPFATEDGKEHIITSTVIVHSGNALPRIRGSSRGSKPEKNSSKVSLSAGATASLPNANSQGDYMYPSVRPGMTTSLPVNALMNRLLINADSFGSEPDNLDCFTEKCVMNNYFGIGLDAKISLDFNNKRDEHPKKCRSRTKNMMWYGVLGTKELLQRTYKNLEQRVLLEVRMWEPVLTCPPLLTVPIVFLIL
ncbi:unnamed protein product [Ranitomeya imitator]|uniref:Diacylglycerol kinase n=1 Tax=Ranitomeya imitator TaxID=111125 RepID=A0ABN9L243_9NEOB|nr:unnamed protein product [Ranitomeya imitator]